MQILYHFFKGHEHLQMLAPPGDHQLIPLKILRDDYTWIKLEELKISSTVPTLRMQGYKCITQSKQDLARILCFQTMIELKERHYFSLSPLYHYLPIQVLLSPSLMAMDKMTSLQPFPLSVFKSQTMLEFHIGVSEHQKKPVLAANWEHFRSLSSQNLNSKQVQLLPTLWQFLFASNPTKPQDHT